MSNEVESLDRHIEEEMRIQAAQVADLKNMKAESSKLYEQAIKDLQAVSQGKEVTGPYQNFSMNLADAILMDLEEDQLTEDGAEKNREEINRILANDATIEFMGDPEHFVSIDDAVENGELKREALL